MMINKDVISEGWNKESYADRVYSKGLAGGNKMILDLDGNVFLVDFLKVSKLNLTETQAICSDYSMDYFMFLGSKLELLDSIIVSTFETPDVSSLFISSFLDMVYFESKIRYRNTVTNDYVSKKVFDYNSDSYCRRCLLDIKKYAEIEYEIIGSDIYLFIINEINSKFFKEGGDMVWQM